VGTHSQNKNANKDQKMKPTLIEELNNKNTSTQINHAKRKRNQFNHIKTQGIITKMID
jgi:hypothetical protein